MYSTPGTPWYQNFTQTRSMNFSGKVKRLMGPRNHEIFFPDMFMEHCLGNYPYCVTAIQLLYKKKASPPLRIELCTAVGQ